jgi:hypothetical protein
VERVINVDPLELEAAQKRDASIALLEGKQQAMAGVARP